MVVDARRINKEITECTGDRDGSGISAYPLGDSLQHFEGLVSGPADSPYAGGLFSIDIRLPSDYPFEPPKMQFITKVWHPNVSSITGAICLDILTKEWSPAFSIRTTLLSILALLTAPEPDDPQDAQVAQQYTTNPMAFTLKAKEWTQKYATPEANTSIISPLLLLGLTISDARRVYADCGGDIDKAVNVVTGNR